MVRIEAEAAAVNVYDFDGTIYPGDCSIGFAFWCMNRHPKLWFTYFPRAVKAFVQYKMGKIPNYQLQCTVFSYLMQVNDFEVQIERYWDRNERKISTWYLAQKRPDDLIISASPLCIIERIAGRLGVNCVATEYDREYGVLVNNLMYATEKSMYMIDRDMPQIDNFYSDSLADTPLALLADKAHLVTNNATAVTDWPKLDDLTAEKVKKKIDTGWSIHLG
ncbi:MAG: haloacid dehalogenase-like hydrolase [Eggerthellaceae bacterium]|nr:haloacid dehalogenase-like hydrolase [Eggerthellaceae bacterium]